MINIKRFIAFSILASTPHLHPYSFSTHENLLFAIGKGDIQEVRTLIEQGADVNYPHIETVPIGNDLGKLHTTTPLYAASICGFYEIAELLLQSGATFDQKNIMLPDGKLYSLIEVLKKERDESISTTRSSLSVLHEYQPQPTTKHTSIESTDLMGLQLIQAILQRNTAVVRQLLDAGISVDYALSFPVPYGPHYDNIITFRPLYYALSSDNPEIIKLLLDYGANPQETIVRPSGQICTIEQALVLDTQETEEITSRMLQLLENYKTD